MAHKKSPQQLGLLLVVALTMGLLASGGSPAAATASRTVDNIPPSVEPEPPQSAPPETAEPGAPEPPTSTPTPAPTVPPPVSTPTPTVPPPTPAPTQPPAPLSGPVTDSPELDDGGLLFDADTGQIIQQPTLSAIAASGYAVSGGIRYNNGVYTLHFVDSPRLNELYASIVEAVNTINASGTVYIGIGKRVPAKPTIIPRGELYLSIETTSPCGTNWAGCGGASTKTEDGVRKAVAGQLWVHPLVFNYDNTIRRHVITHELGHTLGLSHYDLAYNGQWQLMNSSRYDAPSLAAGDLAGLNYLRHPRPIGNLDAVTNSTDSFSVSGWALDGVHSDTVTVHVYVNGSFRVAIPANTSRPDVQTSYGRGANHGFTGKISQPPGGASVCAYATHRTLPISTSLGCKTVTVTSSNKVPIGNVDAVRGGVGSVTATGWALDPNTTDPISVHIYVDGKYSGVSVADLSRPDVESAHKMGALHGFSMTVNTSPGTRSICIYAINSPAGTNPLIQCKTVSVAANLTPFGSIDGVASQPGGISVRGWALDPNTTAPISIHLYVDGRYVRTAVAQLNRPDVQQVHRMGPLHGYWETIPASPGQHQVCVYAINTPNGNNTLLGCAVRVVPN